MRRGERQIFKERLPGKFLGMFLEALDGVVRDESRRVVICSQLHRWHFDVVREMQLRIEEPVMVVEGIRVIKAGRQTVAIQMPFAGMIGAITERLEVGRQQLRPARPHAIRTAHDAEHAILAAIHFRQQIAPDRLRIIAGENGGA